MDVKILTRVRGLLTKAESTEFADEAEALTAKAAELVAKYGIDQALLAAAGKTRDEIGTLVIHVATPYALDKDGLLYAVSVALRCKGIKRKLRDGGYRVTVVGFQSDLERVELLYTSLLTQGIGQLTHIRPTNGESTTSYRKSWFAGFAVTIGERLREAERRAAADADSARVGTGCTSTALVLVDRQSRVEQAYDEMFPKARSARSRSLRGGGYGDGRAAGQRADLGNARVGGRKEAIGRG